MSKVYDEEHRRHRERLSEAMSETLKSIEHFERSHAGRVNATAQVRAGLVCQAWHVYSSPPSVMAGAGAYGCVVLRQVFEAIYND